MKTHAHQKDLCLNVNANKVGLNLQKKINRVLIMVFLTCIFIPSLIRATPPDAPYNLRTYDKYNPTGTDQKPYFGWYFNDPDDDEIQSAYQIIIASSLSNLNDGNGDSWNSGKINSRKQNYVYPEGFVFSSGTRYYWKVRTWDKDGNIGPYSAPSFFETGLNNNSDWEGAKWIKRETKNTEAYTYFRKKTFIPDKKIERATAYISACHSYELYLNGTFIGKGFFHHYPQFSYYHAWDISNALMSNSNNVIACLTHWYGGGQGRAAGAPGLLVKIKIEFSDSTSIVICSDSTWKQKRAEQWIVPQPQRNGEGIGHIEKIDSRQIMPDWNSLNLNDSLWENVRVIGSHPVSPWTGTLKADLTRVTEEEIKPESITDLGNGKFVIDLGKIYAGSFKIAFNGGVNGDTIKMYGGFTLNDDGTVSSALNQQTNLDFYFIHNGNKSEFYPYVYLGLRYLQVNNSPNRLTVDNVRFISRHYELNASNADFSTSIPMLNRVWELMCHSLLVGAQEGFVDTPTREKGTFLGDGWSQSVPAMSIMGDRIMTLRVLNEFLDSQNQYWPDGRLNAVYPNGDGARDIPDYTQSFLVWVWDYYMQTGNDEFLTRNYERLKKIADYVDIYTDKSTGLIHNLKGGKGPYQFGIIDWPEDMRYGYDMSAVARTVINVYAFADFDIISKIAEITGNIDDRDIYRKKAEDIKKAINQRLLNSQGIYTDGLYSNNTRSKHVSQHANILPLALDIVPRQNIKKVVTEIKKRTMNVGMICLRWLPEALGKANEGSHLIKLYTNKDWDGWAKTIALGGTVTWESWNANETNESMSHPWGAVGLLAMQQYLLGVKSLKPQHEVIQIKPLDFGNSLKSAKGVIPTDKGNIIINWIRSSEDFQMTINIPDNITSTVYVPKCGITGNVLEVDGTKVQGIEDEDYLFVENIGSGIHLFKIGIAFENLND